MIAALFAWAAIGIAALLVICALTLAFEFRGKPAEEDLTDWMHQAADPRSHGPDHE